MKILNFSSKNDLASLVLRLMVGGMFFLHGIGKPIVVGMEEVISGFIANGFPDWTAYASTIVEIIGGLMLLLGLQSRLAALALTPVTLGIIIYHFPNGWVFHNPGGGWEYPQLILISLITIILLGGGRYSISKN